MRAVDAHVAVNGLLLPVFHILAAILLDDILLGYFIKGLVRPGRR